METWEDCDDVMSRSSRWTRLLPVSQWFKLIWDLFGLMTYFMTQGNNTHRPRPHSPLRERCLGVEPPHTLPGSDAASAAASASQRTWRVELLWLQQGIVGRSGIMGGIFAANGVSGGRGRQRWGRGVLSVLTWAERWDLPWLRHKQIQGSETEHRKLEAGSQRNSWGLHFILSSHFVRI